MRGHHHPLHPRDADGARGPARAGRQGDRAAQPPRLVELPLLPLLRARVDVPELRRRARAAPRPADFVACHHCGHRERVPSAAATAARSPSRATAPAPSGSSTSCADALGDAGFPVFRLDADVAGVKDRAARTLERVRPRRAGRARRHADGRQGPRLPGRHARGRARCRPDAALPGLPRRGADVRARHPARRPGRPGAATAHGRVLVQTLAPDARSIRFAARHDADGFLADELARRRALGYPPFASLIRIVCSAPERGRRARLAGRAARRDRAPRARPCSVRRRCSGCAAARAASS